MPGNDSAGFIVTTVLGVVGAVIATTLGQWMGFYQPNEPAGFLMSVIGAMILLFFYRGFSRRKAQ